MGTKGLDGFDTSGFLDFCGRGASALAVGRDDIGPPSSRRSAVSAGLGGGAGFFRLAGLTYACALCSSTACLLRRDR